MSKEKKEMKAKRKVEKRTKKLEAKEARRKAREKPYRVHVESRNRFIKWLVWLILICFLALGAFSFITREDSASVKRTLSKAVASVNENSSAEESASALALAFVYDYFTYDPEAQEAYVERINAYAADGLTFNAPSHGAVMSVKTAAIKDVDKDESGNVDVTIQAKIEATGIMRITTKIKDKNGKEEEKTTEQAQTTTRLLNYRVPVNIQNGNCAVIAEPILVADQNAAKKVQMPEALSGEVIDDAEKNKVSILVSNFLKAYYGTDKSELLYFVTDDFGSVNTVGEELRFRGIEDIAVVPMMGGGYEAEVTYRISDNMIEQTQTVYLQLIDGTDGRLYVDQLKTRK